MAVCDYHYYYYQPIVLPHILLNLYPVQMSSSYVGYYRLQASWKTAGTLAPAASFTIRLYGEQAAAQFRKGAPATELGRLSVDRPAATRDAWLAGEAVALASAFVLAALAITSRAGIAS